jgi:methionyl-tRNA formyltransferase
MIKFVFFGSSDFSIYVLDALKAGGFVPTIIVTTPDKPKGRGLVLTPTPVKLWGQKNNIPVLDPVKLDADFLEKFKKCNIESLSIDHWPLFIVASYGKIIPETIINMPAHKTLNVHPSLLPKYRGASPIQNAILDDTKNTGVTIIRIDKEMDHGPIVAEEKVHFDEWPTYEKTEEKLGTVGGDLLAKILPDWIPGKIKEVNQDHSQATFTKKIVKEDGLFDPADLKPDAPTDRAHLAFRKIQAYHSWPGTYFYIKSKVPAVAKAMADKQKTKSKDKIRIKITSASWQDNRLTIEKVIPEGKKEIYYKDFLNR